MATLDARITKLEHQLSKPNGARYSLVDFLISMDDPGSLRPSDSICGHTLRQWADEFGSLTSPHVIFPDNVPVPFCV